MIRSYFRLDELGTDVRREIIGGATTFLTMAYIIVVNPGILTAAGIPFNASVMATIISAAFGTLLMGVYARRPFAIAPYMGENAFIAFTVVKGMGCPWQTAIGAIFIGGVLFTVLTLLKVRSWLANAIPEGLKLGFSVGIGLFLAFVGLNETGITAVGNPGAPVHVGLLSRPDVLLAIFSFFLITVLVLWKVRGGILIGILAVTALAFLVDALLGTAIAKVPERWIGLPSGLGEIWFKLDILGALTWRNVATAGVWGGISVILTVFVMDFVDTMATLLGVSYKAGMLDEHGNLPEIEKPMLCDSFATIFGALMGTTTTGTFIESASGIEAGARSGLASVVTGVLFLAALFLTPFAGAIPKCAYAPALIVVGAMMLAPIRKLKFDDMTEVVPVFVVVALTCFTYNLGIGMAAGFVVYPLMKLAAGRTREVPGGLWVLALISLLLFIFYPYGVVNK